ncbi:transposase [Streptomyces sp. ISL-96]|uniref:RNA-guided endonuclease InsQ/TnpB family protein n=1 Tax=Streptomyces sp. ISL-96 TaxID=2819191 RepID=UPI001BE8592A|nr:RNA-guided endonuclease TnpB family protein [Streptomyces sp. ISL-96]MBT2493495.1 transposase [Streptomyces sp. ISL-96]
MRQRRGYRARLALTCDQAAQLDQQAHAARALWNLLHELFTACRSRRPPLAYMDGEIRWARANVDWLGMLPAQAAQAVLKTYHRAWVNCWEGRADQPIYKSRARAPLAVDIPQGRDLQVARVHRRWGMVSIPKVGRVRFRWTKDLPGLTKGSPAGRITGARLVKDALGWHIAFRIEHLVQAAEPRDWTDSHVGIDRGITVPLALSDGSTHDHASWLDDEEEARLLRAEQRAAHRKRYRKAGERTSKRLCALYDQIKDLRARAKRRVLDWQHKTTTAIADAYALVSVEQLDITNMLKSAKGNIAEPGVNVAQKSGLNRKIAGEAWGRSVQLLAYKVLDRGGLLVHVPAPGTSLRCSMCEIATPGNRESQAEFVCKNSRCGWSGNADHNAGRNIDRAGFALASAAGRAVVRQT